MSGERFQAEKSSREAAHLRQDVEEYRRIVSDLNKRLAECKKEKDDWKKMALRDN